MNADPAFLFYLLLFLNSSLYSLWTKLQEFHNNFFFIGGGSLDERTLSGRV